MPIKIAGVYYPQIIEEQGIELNKGTWKEIPFRQAKGFFGNKKIFSNRSGSYVLAEKPPHPILYSIINSPPAFSLFLYNRTTKQLRVMVGGELIGQINISNSASESP